MVPPSSSPPSSPFSPTPIPSYSSRLLSLLIMKPLCAARLAKHGLYISVSKNFQDSWRCSPSLLPYFPLPCHRPSILYSKSTTSPGRLDRKQTPRMVSNQVFLYQLKYMAGCPLWLQDTRHRVLRNKSKRAISVLQEAWCSVCTVQNNSNKFSRFN